MSSPTRGGWDDGGDAALRLQPFDYNIFGFFCPKDFCLARKGWNWKNDNGCLGYGVSLSNGLAVTVEAGPGVVLQLDFSAASAPPCRKAWNYRLRLLHPGVK